jgi:hypothetical protein
MELTAKNRINKIVKAIWNISTWFLLGYGSFYILRWVLGGQVSDGAIEGFIWGSALMFFALTLYGIFLQKKVEADKQAGLEQFLEDQKTDVEQQAKIDKEMIDQLRNEHELSGNEQDQRLKALETALKHLRYKK